MSNTLYHTKYLDLKEVQLENGHSWIYAHRPNADDAVVILATTEDEVLFLIEERPPMQAENKGKYSIGLAAGLVGDERHGESVQDALAAELLEETGLVAECFEIKTNKLASSAGCVSETCIIAFAKIKDKTVVKEPVNDGGVIVDRIWVKKNNIKSWLKEKEEQGYILTAQTLAALFYLYE